MKFLLAFGSSLYETWSSEVMRCNSCASHIRPVLCVDNGSGLAQPDTSNMSVCSDEGLDVSQQLAETVFSGSSLDSDAEDVVSGNNNNNNSDNF